MAASPERVDPAARLRDACAVIVIDRTGKHASVALTGKARVDRRRRRRARVRLRDRRCRVEAPGNSVEDLWVPSLVEAIPRLNVDDGAELRVAHTETHSWSIDVTGTIWARKRVEVTGIEGLLAEAVSWLLARRLRVPVPDAAVTLSGDLSWLSKQITPVVHWDAIIVDMVVHACHLANEPQGELITTTLVSRCARARELTDEYLMRIGATR